MTTIETFSMPTTLDGKNNGIWRPSIGILNEETAVTSLTLIVREAFRPCNFITVSGADLQNVDLMKSLDMLVLPGVSSEDTPYPRLFERQAHDALTASLESGLIVWASCAAAYHASDKITYISPRKQVLDFQGLSLLPGHAWGPVDTFNNPIDPHDRFSDTRVLNVTFNDASGKTRTGGVCYGNGPAYIPVDGEYLEVAARYADLDNTPIAVAYKPVGLGLLAFVGLLPEIALSHIPAETPKHPSITRLRKELEPAEENRAALMSTIVDRFERHWQRLHPT